MLNRLQILRGCEAAPVVTDYVTAVFVGLVNKAARHIKPSLLIKQLQCDGCCELKPPLPYFCFSVPSVSPKRFTIGHSLTSQTINI